MTAYLLFVVGCVAQKVYFDCGAKVDVVDVQGLILSPGFPYNYSSGTHCVWQFVVPINYQLILEIFDFDVFESHDAATQYSAFSNFDEEDVDEEGPVTQGSLAVDGDSPVAADAPVGSAEEAPKSQEGQIKQVVVRPLSAKMEIAKVSNSAKRSADASASLPSAPPPSLLLLSGAVPPGDKVINSASSSHLRGNPKASSTLSAAADETTAAPPRPTDSPTVSPETQQSVLDACPHDVLYISDLITFSSRFCGSKRPPSSQLVFGSSQEMVEVIMELITTTHWGRGFALLFHYHNLTEPGGERHAVAPAARNTDSLLAAVSGAAFFAMILTSTLCIIFRPKLCPKRGGSSSSCNSEVPEGVQNAGAEVSELQLIAENQAGPETAAGQDDGTGPRSAAVAADVSQNAEVDASCSGLTELDLGADEVFVVSASPTTGAAPFPQYTRERFLRHSDTGPAPAGDWPSPDSSASPAVSRSVKDGGGTRPRAWSVRTFQDFLPPLPQLHRKWCSWNSASPFTKLVDSAPSGLGSGCRGPADGRKVFSDVHLDAEASAGILSDSSISNASYPLTQSAQRQRRLNSASNLRRSRFTGPCFGLLSGPADPAKSCGAPHAPGSPVEPVAASSPAAQCHVESGQAGKRRDFAGEGDHISVPVFAISEEEDRQPLVPAEHLDQTPAAAAPNGLVKGKHEGKGGRSEAWRPWGSQAAGGVGPLSSCDGPPRAETYGVSSRV